MTVTHSTAVRNAACDAVVDLVDGGSTNPNGKVQILDGATVLSTHNMANPAFGAASSGIATAGTIQDDSADNTGTADAWRILDRDETEIMSGEAGQKRDIVAVSTGAGGYFEIAGDHTTEFTAGTDFSVTGSTGNDGYYTANAVEYTGGNTRLTVEADQTVANATVDGQIHKGEVGLNNASIVSGQTVSVTSLTYTALPE